MKSSGASLRGRTLIYIKKETGISAQLIRETVHRLPQGHCPSPARHAQRTRLATKQRRPRRAAVPPPERSPV